MSAESPHITVCVCTYQRPVLLDRLLRELAMQTTGGRFTFSVAVVDNDEARSAAAVVARHAGETSRGLRVEYAVEPRRSISHARNRSLEMASGALVAFIDDDEFPAPGWLLALYEGWRGLGVEGVLGPVRPHFDDEPPAWVRRGRFYERPEHPTGHRLAWEGCRTGNVLFERRILEGVAPVFRAEFGTGSGDQDFFRRMIAAGWRFAWCNEAVVMEAVPPSRWSRSVMLRRALLRGQNSIKHPCGRGRLLLKAAVAVPAYAVALPFLQLAGHHWFMRYAVKLGDHAGRLLAFLGMPLVRNRAM